jgi:hypothetical protein
MRRRVTLGSVATLQHYPRHHGSQPTKQRHPPQHPDESQPSKTLAAADVTSTDHEPSQAQSPEARR